MSWQAWCHQWGWCENHRPYSSGGLLSWPTRSCWAVCHAIDVKDSLTNLLSFLDHQSVQTCPHYESLPWPHFLRHGEKMSQVSNTWKYSENNISENNLWFSETFLTGKWNGTLVGVHFLVAQHLTAVGQWRLEATWSEKSIILQLANKLVHFFQCSNLPFCKQDELIDLNCIKVGVTTYTSSSFKLMKLLMWIWTHRYQASRLNQGVG